MTNNQKLRREMQGHIRKALLIAKGQLSLARRADAEVRETDEYAQIIGQLEWVNNCMDQACFLSDEREARDAN